MSLFSILFGNKVSPIKKRGRPKGSKNGVHLPHKEREEREKRSEAMLKMYCEEHITLEEIAGRVGGITRERVRQLIGRTFEYLNERERRHANAGYNQFITSPCARCGVVWTHKKDYKYCTKTCKSIYTYLAYFDPELAKREYRRMNNVRSKKYYHEHLSGDPVFKAKTKIRNAEYQAKHPELKEQNFQKMKKMSKERYLLDPEGTFAWAIKNDERLNELVKEVVTELSI